MCVMLGLPVMLGVSVLSRKWSLRLALAGTLLFMLLLALVPFIGKEANGAHRWIGVGGFLIQPSEFLKPLFIVPTAWLLALGHEARPVPAKRISAVLLALVVGLLFQKPDIGHTALFGAVWMVQSVLSGLHFQALAELVTAG